LGAGRGESTSPDFGRTYQILYKPGIFNDLQGRFGSLYNFIVKHKMIRDISCPNGIQSFDPQTREL
jgi:hypothetical protein